MSKQDYYDLLGVDRGVDAASLKKAFRKAAMQYHPDRNPGDAAAEQKFKDINEAYDVLKDPDKRAAYDRFGHAAFENGGGPRGGGGGFEGSFSDIFDEFFGDIMGGGRRRGRSSATRGGDMRYNMEISLEDAYRGLQSDITIPTTVACDGCSGSGAEPGTSPQACTTCGGIGKVRAQQGFFVVERTCPSCSGAGQVIADPCKKCRGAGRLDKEKTLSVKVPQGVEDGTRIRLAGEGEAGLRGGPSGDLYIFLSVKPHRLFEREGTTIYCRVPIPMTTAVLGGDIEVPTIEGKKAKVKVPEGTQAGRQFRLRGKGMPQLNSTILGDMIIETMVETPVNLTKKQKELMRQFADEGGDTLHPESSGFFARVKEFWDDLTD